MNNAIRSIRTHNINTPSAVFISPSKLQYKNCCSVVRFRKFTTFSSKPDNTRKNNMDKAQNQDPKSDENLMSHSFGEGYATRSDEEGFGGIYGGNQELPKNDIDKKIHENHPAYDKSQGSEVKDKEKGRHQTNCNS